MDIETKAKKSTLVTFSDNPLSTEPTEMHLVDFSELTIDDIIKEYPAEQILVSVDGKNLTLAEARKLELRDAKQMHVQHFLCSGGGTNPLRAILSIGLSFLTFGIGAGAIFGGLSTIARAAVAAGVFVGGSLLINAIAPVATASQGETQSPEDVFSVYAASNGARPYSPLPMVLGTRRIYPDLIAQPYTRFENNDQFLYLLYSTGIGNLAYGDLRIDKTHIGEYQDVTTEFIAPGENVTLFEDNVLTNPGGAMNDTDNRITREFDTQVYKVEVDFEGVSYSVADDGGTSPRTIALSVLVTNTDSNTAVSTTPVSIAGSSTNATTPVRRTVSIDIPSRANHKVTVSRTTAKSSNNRIQDNVTVPSVRFYRDGPTDRSVVNKIAMKIKASEQLSGSVSNFNLLCSQLVRKKETTSGVTRWSPTLFNSSNPGELLYAYAIGWRGGNQQFVGGVNMEDHQIDRKNLFGFIDYCRDNNLFCDLYTTTGKTHFDIMKAIATCGRGGITFNEGRLGVIYDQGNVSSDTISRENVLEGTYSIQNIGQQNLPDEIVVQYDDQVDDYKTRDIRKRVPGKTGTKVSTVRLNGVVTRNQAIRELNALIARQLYLNRIHSCEMALGGLDLQRGQIVDVSNDLLERSESGKLDSITDASNVVLDRDIMLSSTITNYIVLKFSNGHVHRSQLSNGKNELHTNIMKLKTAIPSTVKQSDPTEVIWQVYASTNIDAHKARIVALLPNNDNTIGVTLEDYSALYETAKNRPDLEYVFPQETYAEPKISNYTVSHEVGAIGDRKVATISVSLAVDTNYIGAVVSQYDNNGRKRSYNIPSSTTTVSFPALINEEESDEGSKIGLLISLIGGEEVAHELFIDLS